MITTQASVSIAKPPSEVFAFLDDLTKTPAWNTRCVEVKQVSDGPRGVGAKLHYRYREPGREGTMDGEVTKHEPGKALSMRFTDRMLAVDVAFELVAESGGTALTHRSNIEPRSFFIRLMTPIIRKATQKQTADVVQRLKAKLEAA